MTKDERGKAEFFAKLASIADWKRLSASERRLLEKDAGRLFHWPKPDLDFLYGKTRDWLGGLLDGETVHPEPPFVWVLRDGEFQQEMLFKTQVPGREHVTDLIRLFRERPFPFHRCQTCKRVFVPTRRTRLQKYCSRNCALQAYAQTYTQDEQRKEERKEYMRVYMAERRQKEAAVPAKKAVRRRRAGLPPAGQEEEERMQAALPPSSWKTDEERKAYQEAEQQRLKKASEKKQPMTAPRGRKE